MKKAGSKSIGKIAAFAAVLAGCFVISPTRGRADDDHESSEAKVRIGFEIAPVPLNLHGKQKEMVGLGSYLVNTTGNCNDCHTTSPAKEYVSGGNPFNGEHPKKVNPAAYLAGGRTFGPGGAYTSRNLTPDQTGPAGLTADQFMKVIRTGEDLDKWHPPCSPTSGVPCVNPPADGTRLQVMPWPKLQDLTNKELGAIYEYLSAIPCLEGDPGNPQGSNTNGHRCQ